MRLRFIWGVFVVMGLLSACANGETQTYRQAETTLITWLENQYPDPVSLAGATSLTEKTDWPTYSLGDNPADILQSLIVNRPKLVVTDRSLHWQEATTSPWFSQHYTNLHHVDIADHSLTPLTIWAYGTANEAELVYLPQPAVLESTQLGYSLHEVQSIGVISDWQQPIPLALTWQAQRPITATYQTVVRIADPINNASIAQVDVGSPQALPLNWLEDGDLLAETYSLLLAEEPAAGGYPILVSLYDPRRNEVWLQDALVGYVSVPEAAGSLVFEPIDAQFGELIRLNGWFVEVSADTVTVHLEWQALGPIAQNYTVFTQLLDAEGNFMANHDGPPQFNRFPTRSWQPLFTVTDSHPIPIGAVPSGQYFIHVGLYLPENNTRLPLIVNGRPSGDSLNLTTIEK